MGTRLFRLHGGIERNPAVERWLDAHGGELGAMARRWFGVMRACGDEVRELIHDGCPVACYGDVALGYVNVFTAHVNVGFYQGAALADPPRLLEGNGRSMRHVKLRPDGTLNAAALRALIAAAYAEIRLRVERGE